MIITILAWTGAFLSCLLTIPQAVRTLRCNRLDGLSATTYWIIFANATVWAIWAGLADEYATGLPSLVNGPAALLILHRLHRSHRSVAHAAHNQVAPYEPDRPLTAESSWADVANTVAVFGPVALTWQLGPSRVSA